MKNKIKKIIAAVVAVSTLVLCCVGAAGCNYCAHQLETIEKQESTCIEHGHGYSYRCKKCNKLFAYTTEKGLYEIKEAETLPLGAHSLPADLEGKIGIRLKDGITQATSVFDYEITSKCGLCDEEGNSLCSEEFVISGEHLAQIVPPNIEKPHVGESGVVYTGEYLYEEATGRPYTKIEFRSTTKQDTAIQLDPANFVKPTDGKLNPNKKYNEKYEWVDASNIGSYQRFPLYVPFNANETRYVYYIIRNTSSAPITVNWSVDGKTWADETIQPDEVKPLLVTGTKTYNTNLEDQFIKVSNPNSTKSTLGVKMSIEVTGFFYVAGDVSKLDIDSLPDKLEYAEGETFDPAGLKVYATYSDYCLGKSLRIEEMDFDCGDRPLTKNDKVVTVSYGGKRAQLYITVS